MHHQQQHHSQHQHHHQHLHQQQQHHHHQLPHQQHHDHQHQQQQHQQQQQQHLQDLHLQHPDLHHHHQQQQQQPHQPHQQQQQQHHQFMAETTQWLAEDSQDEFVPKVVHRRAKRIIPDTEKDEKYWEKRKRNNMAAKRSRENKRVLENDIRQKVTCLEESNAMLRKELAVMKSRFGLAPDQNIMTPEERAQCLQEIKANMEANAARRRKESSGSGDDVSSTSPSVYPVTLHVGGGGSGPGTAATSTSSLDEVDKRGGEDSDDSNSPKVEEGPGSAGGDVGEVGYGPSAYGPFNPSPSWGPIGASGMNAFPGSSTGAPGHVFSPALNGGVGGSTKLTPPSNAFQEKGAGGGFGRFVGGVAGMGAYARPPYDYFSQYSSQMLYGAGDGSGLSGGAAPADLSTNRNKRQEEGSSARGASSAGLTGNGGGARGSGMGGPTKIEHIGHSMIPSPGAGSNGGGGILLDDMTAMASSLSHNSSGRSSGEGQDPQMLVRGLTLPTRLSNPLSSEGGAGAGVPHGLAAEAATLANGSQGIKGPEEEHLKRENDALKMAVRTLTAQMEHMKDQVYKE